MKTMKPSDVRFAFFGTPELAVTILTILETRGYTPALIVTREDKPSGRGRTLTPPPAKVWAQERSIDVRQPARITDDFLAELGNSEWDLFVVAAYGKILPQTLLDIPRRGTLNVHPSLLPRLRGPSPIQSAILTDERETGVSVMLLDAEMDHGPILAQARIEIEEAAWPPYAHELEALLAREGATLLADTIPDWLSGSISAETQAHENATYCRMLSKADGLVDLVQGSARENLLKIRGLAGWPGAYTFFSRRGERIRVQLLAAHLQDDVLVIDTVKPEGKREMPYTDFLRSGALPKKVDK